MPSRRNRLSARITGPIIVLLAAVAAYAVYFSFLTITRYAAFEARALDMGNLNQAVWNTARGNWFHLTNQPGTVNRLSLHVEPILVPISWLYWIYDGPPTLLVLQAVIVALGALPTYALARYKAFGPWAALAFAGAFLLNPSLQAANWLEFHPVTLAPTFLIAAFYFLVTGRTGWFAVFAVLAASCKEEIALLVFMMGLYAAIALKRPRLGVADDAALRGVGFPRRLRDPERVRRGQHPLEPLRLAGRRAGADGRVAAHRAWARVRAAPRLRTRCAISFRSCCRWLSCRS